MALSRYTYWGAAFQPEHAIAHLWFTKKQYQSAILPITKLLQLLAITINMLLTYHVKQQPWCRSHLQPASAAASICWRDFPSPSVPTTALSLSFPAQPWCWTCVNKSFKLKFDTSVTSAPKDRFCHFWCYRYLLFVFDWRARRPNREADGQTDGRTGKTRNVAY